MNSKYWKKTLGVLLLLVVMIMTACQPAAETAAPAEPQQPAQEQPTQVEETKPEEQTPAEAKEPVTIKWFMRWDDVRVDNVAMPVIAAFQEQYPNITVEFENIGSGDEYYQKLQTMIAAGQTPDVFYPATYKAYGLGSKGAILPINDFMARDGIDLSAFNASILAQYAIDGQQMCMPLDTAALVVFYNKDLFDAAGVSYPKAGWTWDDFLATAQALTKDQDGDGNIDQFGVDVFRSYWPMMVWANTGHNIFDDPQQPTKFLITDEESIASIQWLADLSNVQQVMPSDEQVADIGDLFNAGKAAMNVVGHWRVPRYSEATFNWDVAPLPLGKTGVPVNRSDGSCFAIAANSAHPEEAWEFVKFLSGPGSPGVEKLLELQQMVPAIVEFQNSPVFLETGTVNIDKPAFLVGDQLYDMYDPVHPAYDEWDAIWKQELGEVWLGNATAAEAVERMVPQVENMLAHLEEYE